MSKEAILGVLRHILTFLGGYLSTEGWMEGAEVQQGVGAAVTLIGLIWSIRDKRNK